MMLAYTPVCMPADVAPYIRLDSLPDQVIRLLPFVCPQVCYDESLHGQRFSVPWVLL